MSSLVPAAVSAAINPAPVGKPGDFDFLTGEWRIHNKFREGEKWIEFPGEATVVGILAGIASIEELRIPAPWDGIYLDWLQAQYSYYNAEFTRYGNAQEKFNNAYLSFTAAWLRSHMPKQAAYL